MVAESGREEFRGGEEWDDLAVAGRSIVEWVVGISTAGKRNQGNRLVSIVQFHPITRKSCRIRPIQTKTINQLHLRCPTPRMLPSLESSSISSADGGSKACFPQSHGSAVLRNHVTTTVRKKAIQLTSPHNKPIVTSPLTRA